MKYVVWALVLLLLILHQDNWLWDDTTLILGWAPITLVYQAAISAAAAVVWYLATVFCWPDLDADPAGHVPSKSSH
jgi:hypothetical protein